MLQSLLHRAWHSAISIYRLFTMNANKIPRILSIQSHVVSGYVGNKSAIFPLQVLGFEVDSINSVQLSNHTGYKVFKGQVLNDKDLEDLISGLIENNLTDYTHLLTGYVGSASFLRKIAEVIHILKRKNPDLIYVCDPVMGDNGKMYVPEQLKEIYKREIVPLADIVIPNQFELELLSDIKVTELSSLQKAIEQLHKLGPKTVSVSSTEVDDKLTAVFSASNKVMKVDIPKIPTSFTGSGDLFAALFLAYSYLEDDIKGAIEKTVNSLYQVLLNTYTHSQECQGKEMPAARRIELRLIQSKKFIENPEIVLFAAPLT